MKLGPVTDARIDQVVRICKRHGGDCIVVLSGVPGTGKSFIALLAAQRLAGHPLFVKEVQFHQSFGYEHFVEGLRPLQTGGFGIQPGVFAVWNQHATKDPDHRYVLLIEELTRVNVTAVLGELMTYIEHRERSFEPPVSRQPMSVAANLTIIATMNPRDRSALEIDEALLRRLRVVDCQPDTVQLREMLSDSLAGKGVGPGEPEIIDQLVNLFTVCETEHSGEYRELMPFGHGIFAGVETVDDLYDLWHQRIKHLLRRPLIQPHPFCETIESAYPWK